MNALTGPSVKISPAFISFSDTLIKTTLPPAAVSGLATKANAQIKIINNGNILSTGNTTIALYASTDGTADGTPIRSYTTTVVLKPTASKTVTIPLLDIPSVSNGNYYLVAQVTDPLLNITTAKSASTFNLASPFVSLAPAIDSTTLSATTTSGSTSNAALSLTITNNGNIAPTAGSTVSVYASTDGAVVGATLLTTSPFKTLLKPAKSAKAKISLSNFPPARAGKLFPRGADHRRTFDDDDNDDVSD